jgi:hypothetical protein
MVAVPCLQDPGRTTKFSRSAVEPLDSVLNLVLNLVLQYLGTAVLLVVAAVDLLNLQLHSSSTE